MTRRKTAIIDLDGCLADSSHRTHFLTGEHGVKSIDLWRQDTDKDEPYAWCVALIRALVQDGYSILYLTGRAEVNRDSTRAWIADHVHATGRYPELMMRPNDDNRADHIVKEDLYLNKISKEHCVLLAVDDKGAVCDVWRKYGIMTLHVGDKKEDTALADKIHQTFLDAEKVTGGVCFHAEGVICGNCQDRIK